MKLPYFVYDVLNTLNKKGYAAYVVGGACRNYFLNQPIHDYDVTTSAAPEVVKAIFETRYLVVETGLKHGTVTLVNDSKHQVEVTTFRKDLAYEDNRHPSGVVYVSDYIEDSKRRDFTINALYYDVVTNQFLDPTNGKKDIYERKIRCIGNPDDRFKEDGLRILRAIRFESCLDGFEIEEETYNAIFRNKDLLNNIAYERIREEFNRILLSNNVEKIVKKYFDIFKIFIPEFEACKDFQQKSRYHKYDVLTHVLKACDYVKPSLSLKLAAILHDVAKPLVAKPNPKNQSRLQFIGHEYASADLAVTILNRLHYDNKTVRKVEALIRAHDRLLRPDKRKDFAKLLPLVGKYNILDLIELKRADDLAHKDDLSLNKKYNELYRVGKDFVSNTSALQISDLKINGKVLIDLGFKPGAIFKTILYDVLNRVVLNELENTLEAETEYVKTKYKI